jgi:SPP1 gp7 family putative phage head morphogenesis protein
MNAAHSRDALKAALFAHRKKMGRAARSKQRKPIRWLYPWATERHYAAAIRAWLRPMKEYVHQYIKNNQEAILRGDSAALVRQDAIPGGSWRRMVTSLYGWYKTYIPDLDDGGNRASPIILMGLGNIADTMNDFNEKQWEKAAKAELGVEFPIYEDWWFDTRRAWQEDNYKLIQKMSGAYIDMINWKVEQAITSGLSPSQLAQQILKIDQSISTGRANLIARDQIGKLNGQVTQARMTEAGLAMYVWSTSGDERVRESHALMDGGLCRWDDALVYSDNGGKTWKPRPSGAVLAHPGEEISCRCCALSYWDELVDEVDQKIAEIEGLDNLVAQAPPRQNVPKPETKPVIKSEVQKQKAKPVEQEQKTGTAELEKTVNTKLSELREWGKETKREQACIMTPDGKVLGTAKGKADSVTFTAKMMQNLTGSSPNSIISMHNHPNSTSFSIEDLDVMCRLASIKEQRVVGSNGKTYFMSVGSGKRPSLADMRKYEKEIEAGIRQDVANKMTMHRLPKGESMWSLYLSERNAALAEKYGWEYRESKLDG